MFWAIFCVLLYIHSKDNTIHKEYHLKTNFPVFKAEVRTLFKALFPLLSFLCWFREKVAFSSSRVIPNRTGQGLDHSCWSKTNWGYQIPLVWKSSLFICISCNWWSWEKAFFWEVSKQKILDAAFKKSNELNLRLHSFSCNFCFLYANVVIFRAVCAAGWFSGSSNSPNY